MIMAPFVRRHTTTPMFPYSAARESGVRPSLLQLFKGKSGIDIRVRTSLISPPAAA